MAPREAEDDNDSASMDADENDPLLDPQSWPGADGPIERVETHISRLYFTKTRVYKLKKPVRLPFLDYRSLEQRELFSAEELRLNRRLAPDVYLRVAPLRRDATGRLKLDGDGETVDWAVEMERLPAERMLDAVLERGEVDNELVRRIAQFIADFHERCARDERVASFGALATIRRNARDNLDLLASHACGRGVDVVSGRMLEFLSARLERDLARLAPCFEQRAAQGRVRDGHGDLHAGNICLAARGIVAYDCVEFSEAFRCADVASDLAFLCMDLDLRGFRGYSAVLAREYAARAGDPSLPEVLEFYKSYRALVRAKVATIRASQAAPGAARAQARADAQRYAHLAGAYAAPRSLILTCGLPASGKTWLARHLAAPFEAAHLSSDVRRKLQANLPLDRRSSEAFEAGMYSPASKDRTYESLLGHARQLLTPREGANAHTPELPRAVVVDATFSSAALRAPFRVLARELGLAFVVAHISADEALIRARMARRELDRSEPSDADWNVYLRARAVFEAPSELPGAERVELSAGELFAQDAVRAVFDRLIAQRSRADSR